MRTKKKTDDGEWSFRHGPFPVVRVRRPRGSRAAAPLPSAETIHSLWVMSSVSAKGGGQWKPWLGKALGCNGDGCLAATEHEAGIE